MLRHMCAVVASPGTTYFNSFSGKSMKFECVCILVLCVFLERSFSSTQGTKKKSISNLAGAIHFCGVRPQHSLMSRPMLASHF